MALDVFRTNFLPTLNTWDIKVSHGDKYNIHCTSETAQVILDAVLFLFVYKYRYGFLVIKVRKTVHNATD